MKKNRPLDLPSERNKPILDKDTTVIVFECAECCDTEMNNGYFVESIHHIMKS